MSGSREDLWLGSGAARASFITLRDLTRRGPLALLSLRGEPSEFGEFSVNLELAPFSCTIDEVASVSCCVDIPDEAAARRFFQETMALVESITENWDKEAGTNELFAERFHYSEGPAMISVGLRLNGRDSRVWVFFSTALPPLPEEDLTL